jgi:hypothetical protein
MHNGSARPWRCREFVDTFSFCAQSPVLQVFYQYEQKMTNAVLVMQWPWILDPRENHQQSYPQAVKVSGAFGQQQKITRRQRAVAEGAEAYDVSLFVRKMARSRFSQSSSGRRNNPRSNSRLRTSANRCQPAASSACQSGVPIVDNSFSAARSRQ